MPIEDLLGPGVLLDVSDKCKEDPDYRITVQDFQVGAEFGIKFYT